MKKIIFKVGVFVLLAMIFLPAINVLADNTPYKLLAPLPNLDSVPNDVNALSDYIPKIINLLIAMSAVVAVLMIVIGGFQYMSTDAIQGKSAGKERIKNAIWGLLLVISAYLILYTINPNLLTLNLNIDAVTTTGTPTGNTVGTQAGIPMTPEQRLASDAIRTTLASNHIEPYRDPCYAGQTSGCVNLNGLLQPTITGLENLQQAISPVGSPQIITITGGTEGGHAVDSTHYQGTTVDLRQTNALDSFITTGTTPVQTNYGPQYTKTINGQTVTFLNEGANVEGSTGAHWHVTFR